MIVKKSLGIIGLMFSRRCTIPIAFPGDQTIHTAFMNYPIDILFLKKGVVADKCENLRPWWWYKSGASGIDKVIEWEAGKFKDIKIGQKIDIYYG